MVRFLPILLLLTAVLIIFVVTIVRGQRFSFIKSKWLVFSLAILLNLISRISSTPIDFHGIEYEDCFVHQANARLMYYSGGNNSIRETIPMLGSVQHPVATESFYHYIGYPSLIWGFMKCFGDTPLAGHLVSLIFSIMSVVIVYLTVHELYPEKQLALICALIYAAIPIVNIYSSATSAEVLSGFSIIFVVYVIVLQGRDCSTWFIRATYSSLVLCALMFAILAKRENIILVLLVPLVSYFLSDKKGLRQLLVSVVNNILPITASLVLSYSMGLCQVYGDEVTAINLPPFSMAYAKTLAPAFLKAILNYKDYSIFGYLLVLLPIVAFKFRKLNGIIFITGAYLLLYSCHWRSYYFLQGQAVTTQDTVRYLLAINPLIVILFGASAYLLIEALRQIMNKRFQQFRYVLGIAFILIILLSAKSSRNEKNALAGFEQRERIDPVLAMLKYMDQNSDRKTIVATFNTCYFQIYGRPDINVFDFSFISRLPSELLERIFSESEVYGFFFAEDLSAENRKRYSMEYAEIERRFLLKQPVVMTDNYVIVRERRSQCPSQKQQEMP